MRQWLLTYGELGRNKNNFKLFVTFTMYLLFLEIYTRVCKVTGLWQFTIKHSTPPTPNQAGIPYPTLGDVLGSSVDWALAWESSPVPGTGFVLSVFFVTLQ